MNRDQTFCWWIFLATMVDTQPELVVVEPEYESLISKCYVESA